MELAPVAHKWKQIGLMLKISQSELNIIQADHNNVKDCLQQMLSEWVNNAKRITWKQIVLALRNKLVCEYGLGARLAKKFFSKKSYFKKTEPSRLV